jgi:hypothetical protein
MWVVRRFKKHGRNEFIRGGTYENFPELNHTNLQEEKVGGIIKEENLSSLQYWKFIINV